MDTLLKNSTAILVTVIFLGLGAYLFQTTRTDSLTATGVGQSDIYAQTAVFIERRQALSQANLDVKVLDDSLFRSLTGNDTPLQTVQFGRPNPFDQVSQPF